MKFLEIGWSWLCPWRYVLGALGPWRSWRSWRFNKKLCSPAGGL